MSMHKLDAWWFVDRAAEERGEPTVAFSYMAALISALHAMGEDADPIWRMGTSAFAFRIWAHKALCPSAMSVFDWTGLLPEAVEQQGFQCAYVSRLWHEEAQEEDRRLEAQARIRAGIDTGRPAIVWETGIPQWGLIIGYDDAARVYATRSIPGGEGVLPYDRLGRGEIPILSVAIVGEPNGRGCDEIVRRSLAAAVRHAEQGEWMDRPDYQDGLPAYEQWARAIAPGGPPDVNWDYSCYYAAHWFGARCYVRDYLRRIAGGQPLLEQASEAYGRVAEHLRPVWVGFSAETHPADDVLAALAEEVRASGHIEAEAVDLLRRHLTEGNGTTKNTNNTKNRNG
ncbi:MAG: hypothetical protein V1772_06515 [Chloroflexota bacterium]